jgi:hypothetical protein
MNILKSSEKLKLKYFSKQQKEFRKQNHDNFWRKKRKKNHPLLLWAGSLTFISLPSAACNPAEARPKPKKNVNPASLIIFAFAMRKQFAVGASSLGRATIRTTDLPLHGRQQVPHRRAEKP